MTFRILRSNCMVRIVDIVSRTIVRVSVLRVSVLFRSFPQIMTLITLYLDILMQFPVREMSILHGRLTAVKRCRTRHTVTPTRHTSDVTVRSSQQFGFVIRMWPLVSSVRLLHVLKHYKRINIHNSHASYLKKSNL